MVTEVSSNKVFNGWQKVFSHESKELQCTMKFGIFLPAQCDDSKRPVLFFLSGLTCTEQNFVTKAGAQQFAAKHGIVLVAPDTSPRGCNLPGEDDSYDFGSGAGFYIDATQEPWSKNYRMYSYITKELVELIRDNFPANTGSMGITGHSMGGHGAMTCALSNPGLYKSVSAFSPICNPTQCQWGQKAFTGYFGSDNQQLWQQHDATCLAKDYSGPKLTVLIDQGDKDDFLGKGQLLPDNFVAACSANSNITPVLRLQKDYDHSYYFIASFIGDHLEHHAKLLV